MIKLPRIYDLLIATCVLWGSVIAAAPQSDELDRKFQLVLLGEAEQDFTIGLALGAGAAKGFAHIGVLDALEKAGLRIDMIAGSSMGAIIGGGYAAGMGVEELSEVALTSDWLDVLTLIDPVIPTRGFIDGQRITAFLNELYRNQSIEDLTIPFAATTVDILNGDLYVLNEGNLANAVRASSSIPIIFNPMAHNDQVLVDGGMIDPVPIDVVRSMGADYIIAVNVLALPEQETETPAFEYLSANEIKSSRSRWKIPRGGEPWYKAGQPNMAEIAHETVILSMALIAANQVRLTDPDMAINIHTGLTAWNFLEAEIAINKGYVTAMQTLEQAKQ